MFLEYYMVALANYASEEFNMAVLESPFYEDGEAVHCFKFYYNFQVGFLKYLLLRVFLSFLDHLPHETLKF